MTTSTATGAPTQLGHLALRVRDVERATRFYHEVVGLQVRNQARGVAFLGIRADASHELALFPLPPDAPGPDPQRVGLYHIAWEMASFDDLEQLHQRLLAHNATIVGYSERQCNVMFLDPDGNELEAIWEPSPEEEARLTTPGGPGMPKLPR